MKVLDKRLERLEARRPQLPMSHVVIYDVATKQPVNGPIPESATVQIWIPDNGRDALPVANA